MAKFEKNWFARHVRHLVAKHWSGMTRADWQNSSLPLPERRAEARERHETLSQVLVHTDGLRHPAAAGREPLPPGTDWRWQPRIQWDSATPSALLGCDSGTQLGPNLTLWHDCQRKAVTVRQVADDSPVRQPVFAVAFEVHEFTGTYLSLSLNFPDRMLNKLSPHFVVRADLMMAVERDITAYARLNLVQGPNVETLLRQIPEPVAGQDVTCVVEFDLAYSELLDRPIEKVWLDMIFEAPHMNAVTVKDLIVSRRPRAEV